MDFYWSNMRIVAKKLEIYYFCNEFKFLSFEVFFFKKGYNWLRKFLFFFF